VLFRSPQNPKTPHCKLIKLHHLNFQSIKPENGTNSSASLICFRHNFNMPTGSNGN